MSSVYLEFQEEQIETMNMASFLGAIDVTGEDEQNEFATDEEKEETKDDGKIENIMFMPIYLYKNPIDEGMEIPVKFDIPDSTKELHLVVARYQEHDGVALTNGKWHIIDVFPSRRGAREFAMNLEEDQTLWEGMPWNNDSCQLECVDVQTLPLEE